MLVRNQILPFRDQQHLGEETLRHAFAKQAVTVGAESRVVPYRFVDIHADKPAIEQVVFDVLDQLALGADREQRLDQAGPEQAFRRNRRPATARVQRRKLGAHALQNSVNQNA